ncbi:MULTISPECIES: outer membrane protein assembly factor BamC [unclassified Vibrio]|uniref:Outer membrane protein assembly factor BamC n=1 Tax=Vibrio sp. HB236076 TaxID=3232307 RepID=A0AB39HEQ5_9VIBR|nr:outer membrane protein assembly factor BamC [Vibrio sp. HB161653]MDP5254818.1 outer membrane protein assembly factor BamC [Vibrio sp. HB161653]
MKFSRQLVMSSMALLVLSACSSDPAKRRQADDGFTYLNNQATATLEYPQGNKPPFYQDYVIPDGDYQGPIGKQVDIRPPQQVLALIPGARIEQSSEGVNVWFANTQVQQQTWQSLIDGLEKRQVQMKRSDDTIETGWINWTRSDEERNFNARYLLSQVNQAGRPGLLIELVQWRQDGDVKQPAVQDKQRYTNIMANLITTEYDEAQRQAQERQARNRQLDIPLLMGKDRSGLPVIIARADYGIVWERMAGLLEPIGFKIEDRNQSQGSIETEYKAADSDFWQAIGQPPLTLSRGEYTFLIGDLANRTSINITDSKGKPLSEDKLQAVENVLAAVIEQQKQQAAQ